MLVNTSLLLLAGHETTINLLCNGTSALIRHPDQWAKLNIIVAVDGVAVGDVDELHRLMTEERAGKPVPMTVLRQTQKLDITVTPRESPPRAAG